MGLQVCPGCLWAPVLYCPALIHGIISSFPPQHAATKQTKTLMSLYYSTDRILVTDLHTRLLTWLVLPSAWFVLILHLCASLLTVAKRSHEETLKIRASQNPFTRKRHLCFGEPELSNVSWRWTSFKTFSLRLKSVNKHDCARTSPLVLQVRMGNADLFRHGYSQRLVGNELHSLVSCFASGQFS